MVPNSAVMTMAAIFKSRLFKNGYWKKNAFIFVTELKLQVRFCMQSLHRYTLLMIQKSQLFWKKIGDEAEVVQCPFNKVKTNVSKFLKSSLAAILEFQNGVHFHSIDVVQYFNFITTYINLRCPFLGFKGCWIQLNYLRRAQIRPKTVI